MTTANAFLRLPTPAALAAACLLHPARADDPPIRPEVLFESEIAGAPNKLMRALRTTYQPGASNPKHYHTSYVVFYVLQGSGVWQEEGKPAATLKPGDSLAVTPGTIHAHWNASATEPLVFTEFVVIDKGQRSTVPMR
jgi:quercetin dioxygenase-like cupin family protein